MVFPKSFEIKFKKKQDCRYGENPQQDGVIYSIEGLNGIESIVDETLMNSKQHQGLTLSFNNMLDLDAALKMIREFPYKEYGATCAIFKHANPSGVAVGKTEIDAYEKAWASDPLSAFGGIVAMNTPIDGTLAEKMINERFVEAIVAQDYTEEALEVFKQKPKIRVIQMSTEPVERPEYDMRFVTGGLLVQEIDRTNLTKEMLTYPNELISDLGYEIKKPTEKQIEDMLFGWKVNRNTKSNTVLLVKNKATIGIGAGQQNRVDAGFIGCWRANKNYDLQTAITTDEMIQQVYLIKDTKYDMINCETVREEKEVMKKINARMNLMTSMDAYGRTDGSVAVSSAFYPFPDTLCVLAGFGIEASLSPSGSIRDKKSYEAANKLGIAMAHTDLIPDGGKEGYRGGRRAFKH